MSIWEKAWIVTGMAKGGVRPKPPFRQKFCIKADLH